MTDSGTPSRLANDAERVDFGVGGMTCAVCASRVERALNAVPGVLRARVNLALERADVVFGPDQATLRHLTDAVRRAGYQARPATGGAGVRAVHDQARLDGERRTLMVSAALTAPLVISMGLAALGYEDLHVMPTAEVLLATPIQFVIGLRFYRGAFNALRAGTANMDVLVALGTTAAYCYSWYLLRTLGEEADGRLYFEASAVIITLVLLGKHMENRAKRSAAAALKALLALRPDTACVLGVDGREREVPAERVATGDLVLVRPGGRVPVDGEVVEGASEVDESLVSGESAPVPKGVGDAVTGGSVNGVGLLRVRATTVGEASTLARIVRLVGDAQAGRASVQRLVDRVSAVFVPGVLGFAAATFIAWLAVSGGFEQALIAAVAVLVIACPCALGLATPTAILTGTGAAAQAGILIRDIDVLERAHRLDAIVFDKTGTLTEGRPRVLAVHGAPGVDAEAALGWAAAVQQGSEHPLAKAILARAAEGGLALGQVREFRAVPGRGAEGEVAGRRVVVGNAGFVADRVAVDAATRALARQREAAGETVVFVAAGDALQGVITLRDPPRRAAAEAVRLLRSMNVRATLLSGDAPAVAKRIGEELGLEAARGGMGPGEKARAVQELAAAGHVVGMVGDGVNDAPALAAAEVGIAMGSGTDIAMATAGITLMRADPRLVAGAVAASRATFRKIRQNLFWAFIYNVVCIPLAAIGYLSPTLAAAAMALSSVSVVGNSLWLRSWRPQLEGGCA